MKISALIKELKHIEETHGDVEVQLQTGDVGASEAGNYTSYPSFFIVPEEYEEEGTIVNMRSWPY